MKSLISALTRRSATGRILSAGALSLFPSASFTRFAEPESGEPMRSELGRSYALAWSSKRPERVADFYADDGQIVINGGQPLRGRKAVADMAAGFYAAFPDLNVYCDDFRLAGMHGLFVWTLEGHHSQTKRRVRIGGWEEWDLNNSGKVVSSRGWFDAVAYENQIAGRASPP